MLQIRTTNRRSPQRMQTCKRGKEEGFEWKTFAEKLIKANLKIHHSGLMNATLFPPFLLAVAKEKFSPNKIVFLLCFPTKHPPHWKFFEIIQAGKQKPSLEPNIFARRLFASQALRSDFRRRSDWWILIRRKKQTRWMFLGSRYRAINLKTVYETLMFFSLPSRLNQHRKFSERFHRRLSLPLALFYRQRVGRLRATRQQSQITNFLTRWLDLEAELYH